MTRTFPLLRLELDAMPTIDVHTHLGFGGHRQGQSLAHLVSYHWLHTELARAGCTAPLRDGLEQPDAYMEKAAPYFAAIVATSNHYAFRRMLHDLYEFDEPMITPHNWQALDEKVRARSSDASWIATVLDRANIRKLTVASSDGAPDDSDRYWLYEYGEFLCFPFTKPMGLHAKGPLSVPPTSCAALRSGVTQALDQFHSTRRVRTLHLWLRDTWSFTERPEAELDGLMRRAAAGENLSLPEQDALLTVGLETVAREAGRLGITLQLFHGMLHYVGEGLDRRGLGTYWNPDFIRRLPRLFERCPTTRFDLFLATRLASQEAASIARSYRNVAVSGGWWHGFTAGTLRTFFDDRLDMLPHTSWNAFYSDGYLIEWVYAKLQLTRQTLALALGDRVDEGFISLDQARLIARALMHDNALAIYGPFD
jgi:hypothetical protein